MIYLNYMTIIYMFELICNPERSIIGKEINVTFTITDKFNQNNFKGKYIYLMVRKNGSTKYFNTSMQRYNSENLYWTIVYDEYKYDGTFLIEARMALTTVQSLNSKIIAFNSFIIYKEGVVKYTEEHNISSINNGKEEIKNYVKNEPNTKLTETVMNKVTLIFKKDKEIKIANDTNIHTGITISKKKYV
jgi:hypothetical protein